MYIATHFHAGEVAWYAVPMFILYLKLLSGIQDIVAEWLTRLTRNQFLSGAHVRIVPMSNSFCASKQLTASHFYLPFALTRQ